MNANIQKLFTNAQKETRSIIGLMSGTSLDGLDVAFCKISNSGENTAVELVEFETISYSSEFKDQIRKVFTKKEIIFQDLVLLNEIIGTVHGEMVLECLKKWNITTDEVDAIASHGQTVFHAPKNLHQLEGFPNATLQIGDGDHIAVKTGIITISDFRQKHVAAGGEGAPLAVYGDYFLFGQKDENRIMLNIGGISNFTFLPANRNPSQIIVTDTGTGNTLIDNFVKIYFPDKTYDQDAEIAKKGTVNQALLQSLKSDDFFKNKFPKSTGQELFSVEYVENALNKSNNKHISVEDLLATLTRFTAETIAEAVEINMANSNQDLKEITIYASGGGVHNPLLMQWLTELLPCKFRNINDLGFSGDAKEAVLFAILANETLAGGDSQFDLKNGIPSVCMGKISLPR
ncbi:anhydro-N-acetylmuramic acid kinase [Flavobacterium sp.]|uniref:anhydro-N-acetylmuramic acid kinase n=1 Tax=Flavobacterium sp. TaxID=239 RepID=UPI0025C2D649|nr:anhydro-N-acetylmuramic acid kinase [Flavobacterium sp.]MBA4276127.1 anhydro-N-acetylmuramic acid kinase [Flavobacterium sp.]